MTRAGDVQVRVETSHGWLAGQRHSGVDRFLGIPYGAPPVGMRRFRGPAAVEPWTGVRDAREPAPASLQPRNLFGDIPHSAEDCLYLNVWTPRADASRRPVMVWLHAGGFTSGSGSQQMYDGARLAVRGDVVVVTLNYRLGVLGFAHLERLLGDREGMSDTANLGVRDQLAALAWVQENISCFGGDPGNVTVFGSSAGAMCLSALLGSKAANGLFHRAIAQSGAADHAIPAGDATEVAARLLALLGGSAEDPSCLWEAGVEQLVAAQAVCVRQQVRRGHPGRLQAVRQMGLGIVADGDLIPNDLASALRAGVQRVPLLIGTNADEWHFYVQLSDRGKLDLDRTSLTKVCESRCPGQGRQAVERYGAQLELQDAAPWELFSAVETDRNFAWPAVRLAELQARHAPCYMYLFERRSPLCDGQMGACHGVEIPYVFGNIDSDFGRAFCGEGGVTRRVSDAMVDSWVTFAQTGVPGPVLGEAWSPYDDAHRNVMRIADKATLALNPRAARLQFWRD